MLAEAVTGPRIPNLIAPLKVPESSGIAEHGMDANVQRRPAQQNQQHDGKTLLVSYPKSWRRWIHLPGQFDATQALLNERLLLSGFRYWRTARSPGQGRGDPDEAQQRADDLRA